MGKKISDMQRVIDFAMEASQEKLDGVVETLVSIRNKRFPKQPSRAGKKRGSYKTAPAAGEKSSSEKSDEMAA